METEKDHPKECLHSRLPFEDAMTKTATLCVCVTQPLWGTKGVCLLDSGFGCVSTLPEFEKKGVFSMTVFKQKGVGWPKGSEAWNVLHHMQGKEVSNQAVHKDTNQDYPGTILWIASMVESKNTAIIANTWSEVKTQVQSWRKAH